nr:hypothetical protein [Tanacetum cinerariifolium]
FRRSTDSEPKRVFWGADEELSDEGSPQVIVYGYNGLPILPVALPSSDYIPGPEEPQTPPAPQDEDEHEPMFIQPHDPDFVPEPIYPEYIPLEDEWYVLNYTYHFLKKRTEMTQNVPKIHCISVMSSASSAVTYTSLYTDSELGRVFWGADEELSDEGSPQVIVYGYNGLPILPVALPSSNYIPGPEEPQTPPAPQDEDEHEPMFIQPHDPDFVPEPIYPEYIPLEDE